MSSQKHSDSIGAMAGLGLASGLVWTILPVSLGVYSGDFWGVLKLIVLAMGVLEIGRASCRERV